jgi:hypothetical protein
MPQIHCVVGVRNQLERDVPVGLGFHFSMNPLLGRGPVRKLEGIGKQVHRQVVQADDIGRPNGRQSVIESAPMNTLLP